MLQALYSGLFIGIHIISNKCYYSCYTEKEIVKLGKLSMIPQLQVPVLLPTLTSSSASIQPNGEKYSLSFIRYFMLRMKKGKLSKIHL